MGKIGIKKKAGTGRNKRGRITAKAHYYGNGKEKLPLDKTTENKTPFVSESVSPPIGTETAGVLQEAVRPT